MSDTQNKPVTSGEKNADVGPWYADEYEGYGTRYWRIVRKNSRWFGGIEPVLNGNGKQRAFKKEETALRAIEKMEASP